MSLVDRDATSADALLTDLYLDALLAGARLDGPATNPSHSPMGGASPSLNLDGLDPAARRSADRLRRDLARVHPSFRFEERLATRLAEAAMAMRLPLAAGAEGRVVPFPPGRPDVSEGDGEHPLSPGTGIAAPRDLSRPLLIGGAVTSAALSIAGAALVAWRRGRPGRSTTAMVRAARLARSARAAAPARATAARRGLD